MTTKNHESHMLSQIYQNVNNLTERNLEQKYVWFEERLHVNFFKLIYRFSSIPVITTSYFVEIEEAESQIYTFGRALILDDS